MSKQISLAFGLLAAVAALPAVAAEAPVTNEGPRVTTQSFGNWIYRCQEAMVDGKPGRPACELVQDVAVQQNGKTQQVMSIAFGADAAGHAVTLRVPLGVRLKPGVGLSIDEGSPQTLAYDFCGPRGCWVTGASIEPLIAGLKAGKTGRAKITLLNGRDLVIEFPLAGFGVGLAALDANKPPASEAKSADAKAKKAK